jgi:hypothetical protein
MKKYQIHVIDGNGVRPYTVFAKYYSESRTSSGYYAFFDGGDLIACYPISRTIIVSIENADEL